MSHLTLRRKAKASTLRPSLKSHVMQLQLQPLTSGIAHWGGKTKHLWRGPKDPRQGVTKGSPMALWQRRKWETLGVHVYLPRHPIGHPWRDHLLWFHFFDVPRPRPPCHPFKPLSAPHINSSVRMVDSTTVLLLGLITIGLRNHEVRRMITRWLQSPPVDSSRVNAAAAATPAAAFSRPGGSAHRHRPAQQAKVTKTGWKNSGPHSNYKSKSKPGARVKSSFQTNSTPTQPSRTMTRFQCPNCERVAWLVHVNNVLNQK